MEIGRQLTAADKRMSRGQEQDAVAKQSNGDHDPVSAEKPDGQVDDQEEAGLTLDMLSQAFAEAIAGKADATPAHGSIATREDNADRDIALDPSPQSEIASSSASANASRSAAPNLPTSLGDEQPAMETVGQSVGRRQGAAVSSRSDSGPNADTPAATPSPQAIVEAILFVGHPQDEPITSRMIAALLRGVNPLEVDEAIRALNEIYAKDNSPYEIVSVGDGYRMQLRPTFHAVRDKFHGKVRETRLSQSAVDLLAVVAYNQPITRERINAMRAGDNGRILNQLVRRELLQLQANPEDKRQPLYVTTDRFLALFGIDNLDALPRSDDMNSP